MVLPNFLIVGAGKAGTSNLMARLAEHPEIYIVYNEPSFFALEGQSLDFKGPPGADVLINKNGVTTLDAYRSLFEGGKNHLARGESSPLYLYSPEAPKRIKHYIPDVKIIAILRDPVERAFSAYMHTFSRGREPITDFKAALEAEPSRIRDRWNWIYHYQALGFYYAQIERYFKLFDRDRVKVYLNEDMAGNPDRFFADVFRFLEVDDRVSVDTSKRALVGRVPKNKTVHQLANQLAALEVPSPLRKLVKSVAGEGLRIRIASKLRRANLVDKRQLSPNHQQKFLTDEVKSQLRQTYRDDILKLQDLIDRDLSHWLREDSQR
ncbi:Sulfotransferase [Geitlerinema sp. FC II]|nr:Sulfotransferase [Geitlerinema sp. FC II]